MHAQNTPLFSGKEFILRTDNVCYKISAFGRIDVELPKSSEVCTCYSGLNKPNSIVSNMNFNATKLFNAYPNPFNPSTTIPFYIKNKTYIKLVIYNSLDEEIARLVDKILDKGFYKIKFVNKDLSSGILIYTLETGDYMESKVMQIFK